LAAPPNWLQLSFGLLEPPRAAPQDALRGAAAPGEAVGFGDGAAQEALGFDAVGAGDGAPQDALGFGAGGFGGAGAGALGAGAAGAVGAGASTFFSFRRMNAACFTIFCAPNPSGGRTLGTGASRLNLAVQPAGPTPAARKVRALGTELLLPPYLPPGCNELSCGLDHAVFLRDIDQDYSAINTLANPAPPPHDSSPRVNTTADASNETQRPGHTRDSAAETPDTPGPKGRP